MIFLIGYGKCFSQDFGCPENSQYDKDNDVCYCNNGFVPSEDEYTCVRKVKENSSQLISSKILQDDETMEDTQCKNDYNSESSNYLELGYWIGNSQTSEGFYERNGSAMDGRNEKASQNFVPVMTTRIIIGQNLSIIGDYSKSNSVSTTHDIIWVDNDYMAGGGAFEKKTNTNRYVLGLRYEINGSSYFVVSYQKIGIKGSWENEYFLSGLNQLGSESKHGSESTYIDGMRLGYGWKYEIPQKSLSYGAELHYSFSSNIRSTISNQPPYQWIEYAPFLGYGSYKDGIYTLRGEGTVIDIDYRIGYKVTDSVKLVLGYRAMKFKTKSGAYDMGSVSSVDRKLIRYETKTSGFIMGVGYNF